jgi:hypothetical protein
MNGILSSKWFFIGLGALVFLVGSIIQRGSLTNLDNIAAVIHTCAAVLMMISFVISVRTKDRK